MTGPMLTKAKLLQEIHNLSRSNKLINQQSFGSLVIFLSKAIGFPTLRTSPPSSINLSSSSRLETPTENTKSDLPEDEKAQMAEISRKQQKLSEITDMMYVSHQLHRDVLDLKNLSKELVQTVKDYRDAHMKNVVSVLVGDHLLAKSSRGLAELRNPLVVELMSESLGDLSQGQFLAGETIVSDDVKSLTDNLEKVCFLTGGSLLGNSCKSAALLAGFNPDERMSHDSYSIGKHYGITLQLQDVLRSSSSSSKWFEPSKQLLPCLEKLLKLHLQTCLNLVDNLQKTESYFKLRNHIVTSTCNESIS